ncbi:hypothetical protein [Streptomyces griseus]
MFYALLIAITVQRLG